MVGEFITHRVVYSWNKLPESVTNASTLLGLKKSLTTYSNDILESDFNVNDTCTHGFMFVSVHFVDNVRNVKTNRGWNYWAYTA